MQTERLRYPAAIALLAVLPVVLFLVGRETPIVGLSILSVAVIAMSLYYMFSPASFEGHGDHDEESASA